MILHVYFVIKRYGGPGSQNVDSRFSVEWNHYLASGLDFVVAHIDVRGTGFVGKGFMHAVHHQLGVLEASDSLLVVRWNTSVPHTIYSNTDNNFHREIALIS